MEFLIVTVPLFSKEMSVEAYDFKYQRGNNYMAASLQSSAMFDGATMSPPLETLNLVGIDAFTPDQPVVVPIKGLALLGNIAAQCLQPPEKIIFSLDEDVKSVDPYLSNMEALKGKGFRFAFRGIENLELYSPMLKMADYIFIDVKKVDKYKLEDMLKDINRNYRNLQVIACNIDTKKDFEALKNKAISLFDGRFYQLPLTQAHMDISPLKVNLIRLLNVVRNESFEFNFVTDIVQRDTALTLSLMRMVNSPYLGLSQKIKTINHAVTMLGQNEVRKWVTTSVARSLGADRPNELTRLSLIRAKFADNLAPLFDLKRDAQSIFLMGLFSVLDVILEVDMVDALKLVLVSDDIYDALVKRQGRFAPVMRFMENYEMADWNAVSRDLIIYDIPIVDIYDAYIEAMSWYSDLIKTEPDPDYDERKHFFDS